MGPTALQLHPAAAPVSTLYRNILDNEGATSPGKSSAGKSSAAAVNKPSHGRTGLRPWRASTCSTAIQQPQALLSSTVYGLEGLIACASYQKGAQRTTTVQELATEEERCIEYWRTESTPIAPQPPPHLQAPTGMDAAGHGCSARWTGGHSQ